MLFTNFKINALMDAIELPIVTDIAKVRTDCIVQLTEAMCIQDHHNYAKMLILSAENNECCLLCFS
jgi:hypothetical protein